MSQDPTEIDLKFNVLIQTSRAFESLSQKFNQIENVAPDVDEDSIKCLTNKARDLTQYLDETQTLTGLIHKKLQEHAVKLEPIVQLYLDLERSIDDTTRFDEALNLLETLVSLDNSYANQIPLIREVCSNISEKRDHLLANLCNYLDDQKDSPVDDLKHIVHMLVRCGRYSNRDLRLRFLQARDLWFNDECEAKSESFEELTTFFCYGLPKIFKEFKLIFSDSSAMAIDRYVISRSSQKEDGAIINSWLLLKTTTFILSLEMHLKLLGDSKLLTPTMIGDTMEKCFKLTNWLSSIGFDFSSQLRPLFAKSIIAEFKFSIERATQKFETSFTSIVSKSIESLLLPIDDEVLRISNMQPEEKLPQSLDHYPVFKIYCLNIVDALRWIKATHNFMSPINLCIDVYSLLNSSFTRVMQAISVILNTDNNLSHPILSKISILYSTEILPFMTKYCDLVFPEKVVLGAMGLTKSEFKLLCVKEPDKEWPMFCMLAPKCDGYLRLPSNMSANINPADEEPSSLIACRVCDSLLDITNKKDQHVVKCPYCKEATAIKPAPPGQKYIRCPCNCLLICKSTAQKISCPRSTCRKIIVLCVPREVQTTTLIDSVPGMFRVTCGHCNETFLFNTLVNQLARCPHCEQKSSVGNEFAKGRCVLFLVLALMALALGVGLTFGTYKEIEDGKWGWIVAYVFLYLIFIYFSLRSIYFGTMTRSKILDSHP